jgi:hypothetical protein
VNIDGLRSVKAGGIILVALALFAAPGRGVLASPQEPAEISGTEAPGMVLGALSCASAGCHGSPVPVTNGNVQQNEYVTWLENDKHTEAYTILLDDRSRLIARNLDIGEAHEADLCLDCHSYNVDPEQRAATFDLSEGITCEACHGPASPWLGSHVVADPVRVDLGMLDAKALTPRSELCLGCHMGDATKTVNHELLAAGHPDLQFELDTMTALMPSHWREEDEAWFGARQWVVGQAVALRESMRQLERRARSDDRWPEFADFECFACHHNLSPSEDGPGRQVQGAGIPPWNRSHYVVFRESLQVVAPGSVEGLDRMVADLAGNLQSLEGRTSVAETAGEIVEVIDRLLPDLTDFEFDARVLGDITSRIVANGSEIARFGIHSAEQSAMAIEALSTSYQQNTGLTDDALGPAIDELFELLQSTSRYDADLFGVRLESIPTPTP